MLIDAIAHLRDCKTSLMAARHAAQATGDDLTGARQTRADELVALIYSASSHCDRLAFCVEADLRAELYS